MARINFSEKVVFYLFFDFLHLGNRIKIANFNFED